MKKKLFFLATILSVGLFSACDDNEYMLDDSSIVTPKIEIAEEDVVIQTNNGSTIHLKAAISNPSGIASVTLASVGLRLEETIQVNAPNYTLNKEFTIPATTQKGLYLVSVTVNSKNQINLTKEIKILVGISNDDIAPVLTLITDPEEQFKSSVDFQLKLTDNIGLKSIKVWSDDETSINDIVELDGMAEYEYKNIFILPSSYSAKTVIIKAEVTDLFGNTVAMEPTTFKVNGFPEELYLVGGSTPAGWSENDALPFMKLDQGKFRIYSYLVAADGGLKFLPQKGSWDNDWGMDPNEPGTIIVEGEANVNVPEDGFYAINVDFNAMTYELVKMQFGIIGGFNGWGVPTLMDFTPTKGNYEFTITQAFTEAGEFKFKWDGAEWTYNFGAPTAAGELSGEAVFDGGNIKIAEVGTYDIVLDLDPTGYTYSVTKK